MANAMPMAIGRDSRRIPTIDCFCGDGGISMLLGDLMTNNIKFLLSIFLTIAL
jgi:thiamine pyrophosphate-dependent acetolactate synthase large subunit-like protein